MGVVPFKHPNARVPQIHVDPVQLVKMHANSVEGLCVGHEGAVARVMLFIAKINFTESYAALTISQTKNVADELSFSWAARGPYVARTYVEDVESWLGETTASLVFGYMSRAKLLGGFVAFRGGLIERGRYDDFAFMLGRARERLGCETQNVSFEIQIAKRFVSNVVEPASKI